MADFRFRMNPRAGELPHCSAVLNGRGTRYEVNDYRTTLSLKSVVRGAARYHTPQGHYLLTPDTFLILNDGQRYSLEFDGHGRVPTETLCPFFQRGFLEQAAACAAALPELHLDDIDRATPALEFCERLYSKSGDPKTGGVARALAELHAGLRGPQASAPWLEDRLYALAQSLAGLRIQVRGEAQAFPGLRPATRMELYSRLYRGRDFLLSCYDQPLTVAAAARVAGLSPFHFQRMFKLAFGRTPMQLLQQTRLEAARRLLTHTGDGITAICFAVGFESPGSFSWLFRKRFGVSPRDFRAATENRSKKRGENSRIEEVIPGALA
ncbi:MAG TPA: AraC family transcriptional regulator [Bryobacteraceae bacterium]|jgi:AraC-like DNA-binding protein|nr:AraC family transcriptional regulator [Bryobacteraceae bacterium]